MSCHQARPFEKIVLPPTPVLTIQTYYGVVDFIYAYVRQDPVQTSEMVTRLREGAIVEILTSSNYEETIQGKTSRWYQVQYQGRRGWVFGSTLKIFDSLDKARNAAKASSKPVAIPSPEAN